MAGGHAGVHGEASAALSSALGPARAAGAFLLALSLDVDADDRLVSRVALGRQCLDLRLDALPLALLEQVGIRVGRHAGRLGPLPPYRALVCRANEGDIVDDRDDLVANIPVDDNLRVELRGPLPEIVG